MIRKSISDKNHFKRAVLESSQLLEKEKNIEEIQSEMKSEFQEHDIKLVVGWIEKAKLLPDLKNLKLILKITL